MGRLVHFEIHVSDMDRAKKFYGEVLAGHFRIGRNMPECLTLER